MQNFMSNVMPGGGEAQPDDGVPWWMKYAGKAAGIVSGIGNEKKASKKCLIKDYVCDG